MVRIKPWAPWVMADCYKNRERNINNLTTFNLQQNRNPNQKTRRRKRSISCHTKTLFAKLHENSQILIHYITNPFKRSPSSLLHDTCFPGIILPLSHQIFLSLF
jgi:hypothetical protein